ncbi:CocE/NonD family hydrolase, partial [Acinetobacter baumannii]
IVAFEHDGEDARAVIDWIVRQSWSDGRVGMIGDGYSGFAAWAASSRHPAPLKAIATTDPLAPGISFPMSGNIFRNAAYRWAIENTQDGGD